MSMRNENLKKSYIKIKKGQVKNNDATKKVVLGVFNHKKDEKVLIEQEISQSLFKLSTDTITKQFSGKLPEDLPQKEEETKITNTSKNHTSNWPFWTLKIVDSHSFRIFYFDKKTSADKMHKDLLAA